MISAVQSRTMYLLEVVTTDNKPSSPGNKSPMFMEAVRRKTFSSWPHKEYRYRGLIKGVMVLASWGEGVNIKGSSSIP